MEMEKSCSRCCYYLPYYVKEEGRFRAISLGHCKNKSLSGVYRKTDKPCSNYKERKKEDEKKWLTITTKKYLRDIHNKMQELTQILSAE